MERTNRIGRRGSRFAQSWALLVAALLALLLATIYRAGVVDAQARPIALTVQVHTVVGDPVFHVGIWVFDAASGQLLAKETTDDRGQARFASVPPTEIRVRLNGALSNGIKLRHTRQDQEGIWVNLPARDWVMMLRVDSDGLVFPDLGLNSAGAPDAIDATAIAQGTLPTIYPTAPMVAATAETASPTASVVQEPTDVRDTGVHRPTLQGTSNTSAIGLLMVLLTMIAGVVWLTSRHKV